MSLKKIGKKLPFIGVSIVMLGAFVTLIGVIREIGLLSGFIGIGLTLILVPISLALIFMLTVFLREVFQ